MKAITSLIETEATPQVKASIWYKKLEKMETSISVVNKILLVLNNNMIDSQLPTKVKIKAAANKIYNKRCHQEITLIPLENQFVL